MTAPSASTGEPLAPAERLRYDRQTSVVVVIDAQNDFCHPQGLQARLGKDVTRLEAPIRRLEHFLDGAREADVPIVFVKNLHSDATDTPQWVHRHLDPTRERSCAEGSWGAEFFGPAPGLGDTVVTKHRYSAFAGSTQMEDVLRTLGRSSLLFTGFTAGTCVESSLREAVCRDYLVTLVEDCCGDYTERAHVRAVEAVGAGFGLVSTGARILAAWAEPDAVASDSATGDHTKSDDHTRIRT